MAIASLCAMGYAGAALAEGKTLVLEEVVVTATKQEETLNNVGASILAAGKKQIDDMGFRNMGSLVASMPNVNVQEAATGTKLTIRGVGTVPTGGTSSSVATFIDGVYQGNSSQTNNILVDMQRVEVLRGPQGTLFGKNSIAGVMNLITARPTQEFEGMVDLRAGNLDSREGTLMLSGGLTDTLSARFVAYNQHTGDYLKNTVAPGGAGGSDKESYRLSLNWDAGANTNVWMKYQHDHSITNSALNQLIALDPIDAANLAAIDPTLASKVDTKLDGHYASGTLAQFGYQTGLNPKSVTGGSRDMLSASFNHTFDNEYELVAIAGYDRNVAHNHGSTSQAFATQTIYLDTDSIYETKNLEVRLSSPTDDRIRYTVGAYAEKSKFGIDRGDGYINFAGPLTGYLPPNTTLLNYYANGYGVSPSDLLPESALVPALITDLGVPYGWNKTTSMAAYGQVTFDFTDELSLTLGLRYADDKIEQNKYFSNRVDFNGNPLFSKESLAALMPDPNNTAVVDAYYNALQALMGPLGIGVPGSADFNETHHDRAILPAGKLEYRPNPDALYYGSIQTGYKNGGFSTDGLGDPAPFNKEKSVAYELGGKWTLADGRGQFGAVLFHTDFKDLQVANIDPQTGGVLFKNAAEAYSEGLELETRWKLTEALSVGAQYAYLEAKYRSFENAPLSIQQDIQHQADQIAAGMANAPYLPSPVNDLSHSRLTNAPRNSGSVSFDYVQPVVGSLEFQSNLLITYTDSMYTDLADSDELKAHSATLVDLRLALTDTENKWTVALIGHNLTNDRGQVFGTANSTLAKGTYFGQIRAPASYWLQLEKHF